MKVYELEQAALAFALARVLTLRSPVVSETPTSSSFEPPLSCNTIRRGKQQYSPLKELE